MRLLAMCVLLAWLVGGGLSAKAGDCVPAGPPAQLESETVDWTIVIRSGETCLRGLRSNAMTLESVVVSAPAKFGEATVERYGFSYNALRDFKGEDSFSVTMSGTNRGMRGNSIIRVQVSVR
jgi:hypothetical protein